MPTVDCSQRRAQPACALEALDKVQMWLLDSLATCAPRDMAVAARRAVALGFLAKPDNRLRRLGLRLDYRDRESCARKVAALQAFGAPLLQLHLPALPTSTGVPSEGGLVGHQRLCAAWGAHIMTLCAADLAACKPLYIELMGCKGIFDGARDLMQVETLLELVMSVRPAAPPRVLVRQCVHLNMLNPTEMGGVDAAAAEAGARLGASAHPATAGRVLRVLGSPVLYFEQLCLPLGPSVMEALARCVARGGVVNKLSVSNVEEGLQLGLCADWWAAMGDPAAAPPLLDFAALSDGGGEDDEGVQFGSEATAYIPPAAACTGFIGYQMPPGVEASLTGWPALRRAEISYWNYTPLPEHSWASLPRSLERLSLCFNAGVFSQEWLPTADQLLRDTGHLPALRTVALVQADQGYADMWAAPEWRPPKKPRRAGGPPSRVRKHVRLEATPEVLGVLPKAYLAQWRAYLAEHNIGLRLEKAPTISWSWS
jgi:hypothetical protein